MTVDWPTRVIEVPTSDLTLISGSSYQYSIGDTFRSDLQTLEASEEGIVFPVAHRHNTSVTLAGLTLARTVEIINDYTLTFENGSYKVLLEDANHNVADVLNLNSVSIITQLSAGLIEAGTSLTTVESQQLEEANKILKNELITDPVLGRIKVLDDDDSTTYLEADLYEDTAKTQKYRGQGAEVRERLQ